MNSDVAVDAYSPTMKVLHWATAVLIITLLLLGWILTSELISSTRMLNMLFGLHKSLGITVLLLTLFRIPWRIAHPAPPLPPSLRPWEIVVVGLVHKLLYVLLVLQPLTGWMVSTVSTHKSLFFGLFRLPDLPFVAYLGSAATLLPLLEDIHGALASLLALLLVLHVGAAFKHHWGVRDDVLLRMSPAFLAPFLLALRTGGKRRDGV